MNPTPEAVVFCSDGVHYAADEDGHADRSQPLTWDAETGTYRPRTDDDPSHFAQFHESHLDIEFEGGEPITVTEDEAEKVQAYLESLRGGDPQ